jgi:hypothetical protein
MPLKRPDDVYNASYEYHLRQLQAKQAPLVVVESNDEWRAPPRRSRSSAGSRQGGRDRHSHSQNGRGNQDDPYYYRY